jgi:hypothetical protein
VRLGLSNPDRLHACSPDRRPAGMRPYTRKTKCDHIFPSAAALAVPCDHISPERRHRRRGCNHISFATGATPGAEVRSRRRNVAQSVLPSVRLVRNRLRRVRGLLGSQGRGRWERLRFESTRLRPGVRCDFRSPRNSKNPKERQRAQRPGHSALTIGFNSAAVY